MPNSLELRAEIPALPDFTLANHFSICLLQPVTEAARNWIDEHIPDDAQVFGSAIVIEPRYVRDILLGVQADGLSVR